MKNLGKVMLAIILVLIVLGPLPMASCYTVGVKSGDWIEYDIKEFSEEHTQRIEFTNVAGTALTLHITDTMASGLEFSQTGNIDFATDEDSSAGLNFLSARVLIIPNDIGVGDSIYLGSMFGNTTITVLGEIVKDYLGVNRRVIYANFSLPQIQKQYSLYWDKQTGVLVEATVSYGYITSSLAISNTDLWIGGIGWWFWIIIALVIACGIISTKRNTIRKLWRKPQAPDETAKKTFD